MAAHCSILDTIISKEYKAADTDNILRKAPSSIEGPKHPITSDDGKIVFISAASGTDGTYVEYKNIDPYRCPDIFFTNGILGCMAIAIIGTNENGSQDIFFAHAPKYLPKDITEENEVMLSAAQFIATHQKIRVLCGTNFQLAAETVGSNMQGYKEQARRDLSKSLNTWVRTRDMINIANTHDASICFFPKGPLLIAGRPEQAYRTLNEINTAPKKQRHTGVNISVLDNDLRLSKDLYLKSFKPDKSILESLEGKKRHLEEKTAEGRFPRNFALDPRRANKLKVINDVLDAYRVGDYETLRYYGQSATTGESPFTTQIPVWKSRQAPDTTTAHLCRIAYEDALQKISKYEGRGGLRADGQPVGDYSEMLAIKASQVHEAVQDLPSPTQTRENLHRTNNIYGYFNSSTPQKCSPEASQRSALVYSG